MSKMSQWSISIGPFSIEMTPASALLFMVILTVGFVGFFVLLFILSKKKKS